MPSRGDRPKKKVGRKGLEDDAIAKVIALWNEGKSTAYIGEQVGRSELSMSRVCRRLAMKGLIKNRAVKPASPEVLADICTLWKLGLSYAQIARKVERSFDGVRTIVIRMIARGELEPRAGAPVVEQAEDQPGPIAFPHWTAKLRATDRKGNPDPEEEPAEIVPYEVMTHVGLTGIKLPPFPPDLTGMPLLDGVGELPEVGGSECCPWIVNEPARGAGWRSALRCGSPTEGRKYCPQHEEVAKPTPNGEQMASPRVGQ